MSEADRIRWQCRRGLLELDLALTAFLDRHFARLETSEVALFRELLELNLPENVNHFRIVGVIADARFQSLLERLRESCAAAGT